MKRGSARFSDAVDIGPKERESPYSSTFITSISPSCGTTFFKRR
jgi:hypothetical protein